MSILQLNDVTKYYGEHCVLDNICFSIEEPTILAFVAPNGTGKSTLLNIITNIERPTEGEIYILDKKNSDPLIFEEVTYLQDNSVLYPELTGADHLTFIQEVHQIPQEQVQVLTDRLGMTSYLNKQVKKYSLGMKQHLLFAMAVVPQPKLIILDEPLNGLDPSSVLNVREILKEQFERGATVLFSSHNLDEIDRLTDNILFLYEGSLISANDYQESKVEYTFVLEKIEQVLTFFKTTNSQYEKTGKKKVTVSLAKVEYEAFLLFCQEEKIQIHDSSMNKESTQNIYFELYRGNRHENH